MLEPGMELKNALSLMPSIMFRWKSIGVICAWVILTSMSVSARRLRDTATISNNCTGWTISPPGKGENAG